MSGCLERVFEVLLMLWQHKTLADVGTPLNGEESVGTAAFNRAANTDDTLRYVRYLISDHLNSLILKRNF